MCLYNRIVWSCGHYRRERVLVEICAFTGAACERENIRDVQVGEPCRSCRDDDDISPERLHQHGRSDSAPNGSAMVNGHPTSLDPDRFAEAEEDSPGGEHDGEFSAVQFALCQHGEWMLACDECLGPVDMGQNDSVDHEESQAGGES